MLALPGPGFGPGMLFQTISTTLLHQFCILNFRISYSFSVGKFIANCSCSRAARGPPRSQPRHSRAAPAAGVAFLVHHFTLSMFRIPKYALEVSTSSWRRLRLGPRVSLLSLIEACLKCRQAIRKNEGMKSKAELAVKFSKWICHRTLAHRSVLLNLILSGDQTSASIES